MTPKEKITRELKRECSSPKSKLIEISRRMESDGYAKDARQLWNIICRLEEWQNS